MGLAVVDNQKAHNITTRETSHSCEKSSRPINIAVMSLAPWAGESCLQCEPGKRNYSPVRASPFGNATQRQLAFLGNGWLNW